MLSLSSFVLPSYVVLVFSIRITLLWIFLWPPLGRFLFSPLVLVSHYFTQKRTTTLVLSPYIVVYVLCCRRTWSDEDLAEYSNQSLACVVISCTRRPHSLLSVQVASLLFHCSEKVVATSRLCTISSFPVCCNPKRKRHCRRD